MKIVSCFIVIFILCNLVVPVIKPQKVDAAGFALGYLVAAAFWWNLAVAGANGVLAATDIEAISEDFWVKAAEDGKKVSEYQAQLLNYGNQLVYDSVKDAYISGSPHVSGRLLQTLADVIADYYNPDSVIDTTPNGTYTTVGTLNGVGIYIKSNKLIYINSYSLIDTFIYQNPTSGSITKIAVYDFGADIASGYGWSSYDPSASGGGFLYNQSIYGNSYDKS
ncbi:MAG: hypothetical protein ACRC26_01650 [Bacteroidales bacterium]